MGARGPMPEPTAVRIAKGNPGKRRLGDKEPIPPSGQAEPPPWMQPDAREIWDRLAPIAAAMKTLTIADADTFARYCTWLAKWIALDRFIRIDMGGKPWFYRMDEKERITYVGEFPQASELRQISKILLLMEREFGLTPAGRTRIQVEHGAGATPAAPQTQRSAFRQKFLDGGPIPFNKGA